MNRSMLADFDTRIRSRLAELEQSSEAEKKRRKKSSIWISKQLVASAEWTRCKTKQWPRRNNLTGTAK